MKTTLHHLILGIALFFITGTGQGQTPDWSWVVNPEESICDIGFSTVDNEGNIYINGFYSTFDLTIQGQVLELPEGLDVGWYLMKFNSGGELQWMRSFRSQVLGMDVNSLGEIFLLMTASEPGLIQIDDLSFTVLPAITGLLLKLNSSGTVIQGESLTHPDNPLQLNFLSRLQVDEEDNVILSGNFGGNTLSLDGVELYNTGGSFSTGFVFKCTSNLEVLWGKTLNTSNQVTVNNLQIGLDNSIYISSGWSGDTLFIDDSFIVNDNDGEFGYDGYLSKLTSEGDVVFLSNLDEVGDESSSEFISALGPTSDGGVALCLSGPNLLYNDTPIDFTGNSFVKQNFEGGIASVEEIGDGGSMGALKATSDGGFLMVNNFSEASITIPGTTIEQSGIEGTGDVVIFKLNENLETQWFVTLGSDDEEFVQNGSISLTESGLIVGGSFLSGELQFGGTTIMNEFTPDGEFFLGRLDFTTGLSENSSYEVINVFPNPTSESIQIDFGTTSEKILQVSIFDVSGKMVAQENPSGTEIFLMDVSALPRGQYTMLSHGESITYVSKFIKH